MGDIHKGHDPSNPNSGHGWVYARPDGLKAKCGGPNICSTCNADLELKRETQQKAQGALTTDGLTRLIYLWTRDAGMEVNAETERYVREHLMGMHLVPIYSDGERQRMAECIAGQVGEVLLGGK